METLKELDISEMIEISGGYNFAYELGYALGSAVKQLFILKGFRDLFYMV